MITAPFSPRLHWDILEEGKIVVGFSDRFEIKILDVDKNTSKSFTHSYTPVPVKEKDKAKALEAKTASLISSRWSELKKFILENTVFPAFKPAFKKIVCDIEGNILVFSYSKSDEGKYRGHAEAFDAFDSRGNLINHVRIQNNRNFSTQIQYSLPKNEFWVLDIIDWTEYNFVKYQAL